MLVCVQACKHPLLVVGAGANRKMTSNMVRRFVELTKIPWVESQMGKGVIDARMHPHLNPAKHLWALQVLEARQCICLCPGGKHLSSGADQCF